MDEFKQTKAPKQMLLDLLNSKKPKNEAAVYIQDECDELEAEESHEYFEPPGVPRS